MCLKLVFDYGYMSHIDHSWPMFDDYIICLFVYICRLYLIYFAMLRSVEMEGEPNYLYWLHKGSVKHLDKSGFYLKAKRGLVISIITTTGNWTRYPEKYQTNRTAVLHIWSKYPNLSFCEVRNFADWISLP